MKKRTQIARVVSSILLAGAASGAFAQLQDRGPSDPTLLWPQWYRDTNGTALGLCKNQVASPNAVAGGAPMCFALVPEAAGFAGNQGPEIFYNMIEYRQKPGAAVGLNFRYLAALEASYIPGPTPVHGQETVFARICIALNFNKPEMNGDYTVTHPFGVEHFTNLQATDTNTLFGANAAIFFTADVPLGVAGNFDLALDGPIGPFVKWDVKNPGETLDLDGDGTDDFLGDPNYAHTFTGSPFGTNFIRVDGPANSGIGTDPNTGAPVDYILITEANILGQIWSAPIATALKIDRATFARSAASGNSIDVWAHSATNNKLVVTGEGMPGVQMVEDGIIKGKYHAHIEYSANSIPAQVMVTNASSNPVSSVNSPLLDRVEISEASFDTVTRTIKVVAESSDFIGSPALLVEGIPCVPSATQSAAMGACPAPTPATDKCFSYTLPANVEPPEDIYVRSASLGGHDDATLMLVGNPQNIANTTTTDLSFSVNSNGASQLPGLPTGAVIIAQPTNGTIAGGVFTAKTGAVPGTDSFRYFVLDATGAVSNVVNGHLTLVFTATKPTASLDQFGAANVTVTNPITGVKEPRTYSFNVLANDRAATANALDQIDPATIAIVTPPARGQVTVNANGTISFRSGVAGADSFSYKVKNKNGDFSAPATVQVTVFTAAEALAAPTKLSYVAGKWVITGGTNWFSPGLAQTTATCWLGSLSAPTAATYIGSAQVDATGKFQIAASAPVAVSGATATCQTFYSPAVNAATNTIIPATGTPGALRNTPVAFK